MRGRVAVWWALLLSSGGAVFAQPVETVGTRALGMAGAFVAVADDPTAVYWNPAGLAAGPFFGLAIDLQWADLPRAGEPFASPDRGPSGRGSVLVVLATPPLGIAYTRWRHAGADRRAERVLPPIPEAVPTAKLDTDQVGFTVLHSIGDVLTIGGTLKYVHGSAAEGMARTATELADLREAADLDGRSGHAFDVDFGARVTAGRLAVGLLVRNLFEPTFDTDNGGSIALDRQVRAGVAIGMSETWTIALDVDLTTTDSLAGETRRVAAGVERWWAERRVALRGGVRLETHGEADPVAAMGGSVALRSGLFAEAQVTVGGSRADLAWGGALRVAF